MSEQFTLCPFTGKEINMTFKIVLLVIIAVQLVVGYSLLSIAGKADEKAERMYRKWKEERDEREQKISN